MSGSPDALVPLETLADAHALLRGLFEHAPVPYAIYSRAGGFLLSNPAYRRMFGMEPPAGYSLFADENVAALGLLPSIEAALGGEVVDTDVFWYDANALAHVEVRGANRVAIACTAFPLRAANGEVSQLAIAYRDVTAALGAREEAEALATQLRGALDRFELEHENLQRSEAELRATFELAAVGMAQIDSRTGHFVRVNQRLCELTGYEAAELTALTFSDLTHPDDRARDVQAFAQMVSGQHPAYQIEKRCMRKDGEALWLQVTAAVVQDGRAPSRSIAMHVDVTERRLGEEHARAVAERDAEREKQAQGERDQLLSELEQAVRVRDDFLSIAGHEVRTPLTALLLNLQTLTRASLHEPELACHPKLAQRLQKTLENAERLQQLTEELLDVSRIAEGRLRLAREQLDLVGLVRTVITRLAEQALKAGSPVRFAMRGVLWGTWDRMRLEQLVTNLLTNALKYGEKHPVDVTLEEVGACAVLRVRDRGIGIALEDQARIFERYERAVSSRHYGGLGLGLWIARQVVEASGGTITVDSTPGEGACFTVSLPTGCAARASDAG